jgi:hypothetical protein
VPSLESFPHIVEPLPSDFLAWAAERAERFAGISPTNALQEDLYNLLHAIITYMTRFSGDNESETLSEFDPMKFPFSDFVATTVKSGNKYISYEM